jgi:hypothetical protein
MTKYVTITLTADDAWNLGLYLKRSTLDDFRKHAKDEDEADLIGHAAQHAEDALKREGIAPR